MSIQQNISLQPYNTFKINVNAAHFTAIHNVSALQAVLTDPTWHTTPKLSLGEGSNILFTQDFNGLVIHNQIKGIEYLGDDSDHVYVKVGAGENWHKFVMYCVEQGYAGAENLSLIPGTVGAAPVQNIGAYGVELQDILACVDIVSINGAQQRTLQNADCRFGYRNSVFKQALKNKAVITQVTFRLKKQPVFNVDYGAIKSTLEKNKVTSLSLKAISDAVIEIRQSKLPNPKKIGNAGSFFKNPIITTQHLHDLQQKHPDIPFYAMPKDSVKIPAAWLIEQSGLKDKTFGTVATYHKQPLVLINQNQATGQDVLKASQAIQATIQHQFNIALKTEVTIY